jgi:hypothetical protein
VHRALHCAMSGAPAAARYKSIFLRAVRWFTGQLLCAVRCAPDRHCILFGAPILGFLKKLFSARAEPRLTSSPLPASSLCLWRFLPRRRRPSPSPATTDSTTTSCFSPSLSGELPLLSLSLSFSLSIPAVCTPHHPILCPKSNPCEIQ